MGTAQRDEFTIASHLARLAERDGIPADFQNWGRSGYSSFQEFLLLSTHVRDDSPPHVAVFYDGYNDVNAQLVRPSATPTHSRAEDYEMKIMNYRSGVSGAVRELADSYRRASLVLTAARRTMRIGGGPPPGPRYAGNAVASRELADNTARLYARHVDLTRAVAPRLPIFYFWQPALFTKAQPHALEEEIYGREPTWRKRAEIDRLVRTRLPEGVIDIGDALDASADPVYVDLIHTNEAGARLVAERIYAHLRPTLLVLSEGTNR